MARRPPELIELGRVAGSYGVRGWVKVAPQKGVAEALVAAKEWWLGDKAWRVDEARVHSATVVARLAGVETREQARARAEGRYLGKTAVDECLGLGPFFGDHVVTGGI